MLTALALSSVLLLAQASEGVTKEELESIKRDARERRQCVYSHALLFAEFSFETASIVAKRAVEKCAPKLTKDMPVGEALRYVQGLEKDVSARVFDWRVKAATTGSYAYGEIAKELGIQPIKEFDVTD
ncbi:hypothetical protein [Sinorhizobium medicae]